MKERIYRAGAKESKLSLTTSDQMSRGRGSLAAACLVANSLLQALSCPTIRRHVLALTAETLDSILLLRLSNRFLIFSFTLDSLIFKEQGLVLWELM